VSEADRDQVDRAGLLAALPGAAQVKLEGRVLPVQVARMAGISRMGLRERIAAWADSAGEPPGPLLSCLDRLERLDTEAIAHKILSGAHGSVNLEKAYVAADPLEERAS
jgi:exonuclease SbcD